MVDQLTRDLDHIMTIHRLPFSDRLRERRKITLARCLRFRAMANNPAHPNREGARFGLKKDQILLLKIRAERATGYNPGDLQ